MKWVNILWAGVNSGCLIVVALTLEPTAARIAMSLVGGTFGFVVYHSLNSPDYTFVSESIRRWMRGRY